MQMKKMLSPHFISLRSFLCLCTSLLFLGTFNSCNVKKPVEQEALSSGGALPLSSSSTNATDSTLESERTPDSRLQTAFENEENNLQVLVRGTVTKLLSDDTVGDKHQRFILKLASGQTLLIAHNIDIGERVPDTVLGNGIYVYGVYEWNDEGGVIHWTHEDPDESHLEGFIQYDGYRYQ
jgi:hypothetical protein